MVGAGRPHCTGMGTLGGSGSCSAAACWAIRLRLSAASALLVGSSLRTAMQQGYRKLFLRHGANACGHTLDTVTEPAPSPGYLP